MIRSLGITGTKKNPTEAQRDKIFYYLRSYKAAYLQPQNEFHHGDCIGVDAYAHDVAYSLGYQVIIHPPSDPKYRAFKGLNQPGVRILEPRYYLDRNHAIVACADLLLVVPNGFKELRRSGTWATKRYAENTNTPYIVLWPDGTTSEGGATGYD